MQRIAVFLNAARGRAVVEALFQAGHEVTAVITPSTSAIEFEGVAASLRAPANINDPIFLEKYEALRPRIAIVAGFSSIFRQDLLTLPELGTINLHAGRLPQYRGGSPLNWQMIQGDNPAGISVIRMDAGIDTGEVLAEADIPVGPSDTIADLHARANVLFPQLVLKVLADLNAGRSQGCPQPAGQGCYWHQRSDADGRIHWTSWTAARVDRFIRALTRPYPGAWTERAGQRVRIYAAMLPEFQVAGTSGRVAYIQKQGPFIVCADRALLVTEYAFEGQPSARLRAGDVLN